MPPKRKAPAVQRTISTRSHSVDPVVASSSTVPPPTMSTPIASHIRSPMPHSENQRSTDLMAVTGAMQEMLGTMQQMQTQMLHQLSQMVEQNRGYHQRVDERSSATNPQTQRTLQGTIIQSPTEHQVRQGSTSMEHKEVALIPYDGTVIWEEYQVHLEVTSLTNSWSLVTKGCRLAQSLRGPALSVLADLPASDRLNYTVISAALSEQFGHARLTPNCLLQLETRSQKSNESLSDLATDIDRLVRGAFPEETRSNKAKKAVKTFIKALQDRELAKLITLTKPSTVQDALTTALELQVMTATSTKIPSDNRCWGCKGVGHMRAQCPKEQHNQGN